MQINKIKLIDCGRKGIEVDLIEVVESTKLNNFIMKDDVNRKRGMPIPPSLKKTIYSLRYFFFNLTGYWAPPFNKYIDDSLYDLKPHKDEDELKAGEEYLRALWYGTEINIIEMKGGQIRIHARIYTLSDKYIDVKTPWLDPEDDFDFYDQLLELAEKIGEETIEYLTKDTLSLVEAKTLLLELMSNTEDKERVGNQSEEENIEELASILEKAGCVVLTPENEKALEENNREEKTDVKQSKQVINPGVYNATEKEGYDKEKEDEKDNDEDSGEGYVNDLNF